MELSRIATAGLKWVGTDGNKAQTAEFDSVLSWIVIALLTLGLVMVYSSSIATAEASRATGYQQSYYLLRHGLYIFLGILAGVIVFQIPSKGGIDQNMVTVVNSMFEKNIIPFYRI